VGDQDVQLRVSASGIAQIAQGFKGLASQVGGVGSQAEKAAARTNRALKLLDQGLSSTAARVTGLASGVGIGMLARSIMDLDHRLMNIGNTYNMSGAQVEGLRRRVKQLATDSGTSSEELLAVWKALRDQGASGEEAETVMRAVNEAMLQLGEAGVDTALGLKAAAAAFGFDMADPKQTMDALNTIATAAREGAVTTGSMAAALAQVGTGARDANATMTQTLALAEAFAGTSMPVTEATTRIRAFFAMLNDPANTEALDKVGKTKLGHGIVFDSEGMRRSFQDTMKDVRSLLAGTKTDKEAQDLVAQMFKNAPQEATQVLGYILKNEQGWQSYLTILEKVGRADQLTAQKRERALKDAAIQTQRLRERLDELARTGLSPILGQVERVVKMLADHPELLDLGVGVGGRLLAGAIAFKGYKAGKEIIDQLTGKGGAGSAVGETIAGVAGVQKVFVVNMPGAGFPGAKGGAGAPGVPGLPTPGGTGPTKWAKAGKWLGRAAVVGMAADLAHEGYQASNAGQQAAYEGAVADQKDAETKSYKEGLRGISQGLQEGSITPEQAQAALDQIGPYDPSVHSGRSYRRQVEGMAGRNVQEVDLSMTLTVEDNQVVADIKATDKQTGQLKGSERRTVPRTLP